MNNVLILFLAIICLEGSLVETRTTNCNEFYNYSNLLNDSFYGKISTKNETELAYVFNLNQNGKSKSLKLYKNSLSKEVFLFAQKGDIIKKKKEVLSLSVAHFKGDGGVHVKLFNKLCD